MLANYPILSRVDRWIHIATTALAGFGGLMLTAISLMTVVSIIGRELIPFGLAPIPGDYELVEVGCAVAVFSFLPYCHRYRGHMTVDLLISPLPKVAFNTTTVIGDITIAVFSVLIASRLWLGVSEKMSYNESTMILEMPVWYGYALAMVGATLFAIVALFTVLKDIVLFSTKEKIV